MGIEQVLKIGTNVLTQAAKKAYVEPMCGVLKLEYLGQKMGQLHNIREPLRSLMQQSKIAYKFPKDIATILPKSEFPIALKAFKEELKRAGLNERFINNFDNFTSPETLLAQREFFHFKNNSKLRFGKHSCLGSTINITPQNIQSKKDVIDILSKDVKISPFDIDLIEQHIETAEHVELVRKLVNDKDVSTELIRNLIGKTKTSSVRKILEEVKNNPVVMTNRAIRESAISLVPKGASPTKLDPLNIDENSLVLVHMTNYEPIGGEILSTRDKFYRLNGIGGTRNSVHFSLNHPVAGHRGGDWDKHTTAVIMPYTSTLKANNAGKFIEGLPNDLYTNGSVKIPEGSVIIKYNPKIKPGKIKSYISEEFNGVTVIETSQYPHEVTPVVIEKMGYTYLPTEQETSVAGVFMSGESHCSRVEDITRGFKSWRDFCKTQGIKPMLHSETPAQMADNLIENLNVFRKNNNWGENEEYTKSVIKKALDEIRAGEQRGFFVGYDIDKLENILLKSKTPNEAFEKLATEMHIGPTLTLDEVLNKWNHSESRNLEDIMSHIEYNKDAQCFYTAPYIDTELIRKELSWGD